MTSHLLSATIIGAVTFFVAIFIYRRNRDQRKWKKIGTVSGLRVYPAKGCTGAELKSAECTNMGIKYDRHVAFVDAYSTPIRQESNPKIALIKQELIKDNHLRLIAPEMDALDIPLMGSDSESDKEVVPFRLFGMHGSGTAVGKYADDWISKYLGREGSRVIRFYDGKSRKLADHTKFSSSAHPSGKDTVAFANACPFLMISEESLADLNSRFVDRQLSMSRFRPNIIMKGCQAFQEDTVKYLRIGSTEFRGLHGCGRCAVTTIDPTSGVKDPEEPLKTLREYRLVPKEKDSRYGNSPIFGKNLGLSKAGIISCGDAIYSLE